MCPQNQHEMFPICTLSDRGAEAARIGHRLVELEREKTGLVGAYHSLAKRTGIGYRTWRDFWYWQSAGANHGVLANTWERLTEAYEIEIAHRLHNFEVELEYAKALRRGYGCEGQAAN
jgi:hypothetical protein